MSEPRYTARDSVVYSDGKWFADTRGTQYAAEIAAKLEAHGPLVATVQEFCKVWNSGSFESSSRNAEADREVLFDKVRAALALAKKAGA